MTCRLSGSELVPIEDVQEFAAKWDLYPLVVPFVLEDADVLVDCAEATDDGVSHGRYAHRERGLGRERRSFRYVFAGSVTVAKSW
jgi:hypothetical protein